MMRFIFTAIAIMSVATLPSAANAQETSDQKIEPSLQIKGTNKNTVLKAFLPKNGLITSQTSLRNLLVTWQPRKKVPSVDFEKNIVLVRTFDGAYNVFPKAMTLDQEGNLNCEFLTTATEGEPSWFSYYIAVLPRAGIKTVDGTQVSMKPRSKSVEATDIAASEVPLKAPGSRTTRNVPPSNAPGSSTSTLDGPADNLKPVRQTPTKAPIQNPSESIRVDIVGKIQTGLVAMGGETTGTVIGSNGIVWELDFRKNASMLDSVNQMGSKLARVQGLLVRVRGIEGPDRLVVKVDSIDQVQTTRDRMAKKDTPRINLMPKTEPIRKEPAVARRAKPPTPTRASQFESIVLKTTGGNLGRGQTHTLNPEGKISVDRGQSQTSWVLSPERLQKIDRIVANTDWGKLPRVARSKDAARDSLQYQVLIETPRHTYRFFSDGASIGNQAQLTQLLSLMVVPEQANSNPQR